MNREEAIKFFELQTQDEQALIDGINLNPDDFVFGAEGPEQYINDCQNNIDAYETAISALRGSQPDPITGLVPCGCGGKAKYINSYYDDVWMYENYVGCPDCYASSAHISTSKHGYSKAMEDEIKLKLRGNWNRAMGYKGGAE